MNYAELGQRTKAKYPQYSSLSDEEVGRRIATKYPQYEAQVDKGNAITNFLPSLQKNATDIGTALINVLNPDMEKNTVANVVRLSEGTNRKLDEVPILGQLNRALPTGQIGSTLSMVAPGYFENSEQATENLTDFYKQRYGGVDNIKDTINQDPAGFLLDLSTVLSGGGTLATKALSGAGKTNTATRVASTVTKAGNALDPMNATLSLLNKGVSKTGRITQPFKATKNADAIKIADELGVDLPLSAKTTSPILKTTEAWAQKGIFGGSIRKKIVEAQTKLDNLADDITVQVAGSPDLKGTGTAIQNGFENFKTAFRDQKTQLYDAVGDDVLKSQASTERTLVALDEIIDQKSQSLTGGQNTAFYKDLRNQIAPTKKGKSKVTTVNQLKSTRTEIGSRLKGNDPVVTGDRATMGRLYAALSDDLDTSIKTISPETGAALDQANTFYKTNIEKINSQLGRKIANSDPEKLVDSLIKPNSETAVESLKEIIGDEAFGQVQETFFQQIFSKSVNPKTNRIELARLNKQLDRYGQPTLRKILTPEQMARLDSVQQQMGKIERLEGALKSGTKSADGSQTAFLGEVGGMIGLTLVNPMLLAKYLIGRGAVSALMGSKTGQRLLMEGVDMSKPMSQGVEVLRRTEGAGRNVSRVENQEVKDRFDLLRRAQERLQNQQQRRPSPLP